MPLLILTNFPSRVCDVSLPQDNIGYEYFLISIRTKDYIYIGECSNVISRLNQHNSRYGSNSTTPCYRRQFAIMGFICGFNGNKCMRRIIENCGNKNEIFFINQRILDPKIWFKSGKQVILEFDEDICHEQKKESRFIELFK